MRQIIKIKRFIWMGLALAVSLAFIMPNKAQLQDFSAVAEDTPLVPIDFKGHSKMDSGLSQLLYVYELHGLEIAKQYARLRSVDLVGDRVRVVAEARAIQASRKAGGEGITRIESQIQSLGGRIETVYRDLFQSTVPFNALNSLADLGSVRFLRLPYKAVPMETSEGVSKTGANQWHGLTPYHNAETTKVCILDAGFKDYQSLLGSELPSSVTTRSFRADRNLEASYHGTACAEIVHDMAPSAELFLANFSTDVEHHAAVDWIIQQGVDVISYSMGWFNIGAGDGTGPICDDVKKAKGAGIVWVSAAGNQADRHWEGNYRDPDSDGWNNFGTGSDAASEYYQFYVNAGYVYAIYMNWNDWGTWVTGPSAEAGAKESWYTGSQGNDYDLYLYGPGQTYWAKSENDQWGSSGVWPVEYLAFIAGTSGKRYIRIKKYRTVRNCNLELFFYGAHTLEHKNVWGSIIIPGNSQDAVTVGAVDALTDAYHSYSSRGPTEDGRIKPDICAPAGVTCVIYGKRNAGYGFYGTSASTPHVAGAFALMKGKTPFTLDQIGTILYNRVLDLGTQGKDNRYGYGRLKLTNSSGAALD